MSTALRIVLRREGIKCQSQVGTFQKEMTVGYKLFEAEADQLSQCCSPHLEAALRIASICPFILFDKVAS
jgi:hypothetical protein